MPRTRKNITDEQRKKEAEERLSYKLDSLRVDFELGRIRNFKQIEALIPFSVLSRQLRMGYETFVKKSDNPGDFTNNELIRFAELINVDINIIIKFIYLSMKFKNSFKEGESIRL